MALLFTPQEDWISKKYQDEFKSDYIITSPL